MPTKRIAHRSQMAKKSTKKQAVGWTASTIADVDLAKAKAEGFLADSVVITFPRPRSSLTHSQAFGDVSCFPSSWTFFPCP
jgi:hypothetical protein